MKTILVVDDEPGILALVDRLLTRSEYKVLLAETLQEAAELVRSNVAIDLAIVDFWLSGASAVPLLDLLAEQRPRTPIVMITGGGHDLSVETSRAIARISGATHFLFKPIHRAELLSTVEKALA